MAKRGRPKGPCNPKELAQRRAAAWKHGGRAATPLRRSVHPCRPDLCPMSTGTCALKEKIEAAGGALEACLVELGQTNEVREAYRNALETGDLAGLRDMVSSTLAAMAGLHQRELLALLTEGGFAIDQPVFGPDGDGGHVEIGSRLVENPRAKPWLELAKLLGMTADQQAATPKARGETQRAVSEAAHLDWMRTFGAQAGAT